MANFNVDEKEQLKLIEELRELKETKKMTFQEISDKTAENGEYVSVSNIKKVFSPETKHNHDYNRTLLPIFNALANDNKDSPTQHLYQAKLEIKNETIRRLEEQISEIKEEYRELLKEREETYRIREQFYMEQIKRQQQELDTKNEQISHYISTIDRKDYALRELYTVIIGTKKKEEVFR